jgi:hypothetical protein
MHVSFQLFIQSVTIAVIVKQFPLPFTRPIRGDVAIPESTAPITLSDTQHMSFRVGSIQIAAFVSWFSTKLCN